MHKSITTPALIPALVTAAALLIAGAAALPALAADSGAGDAGKEDIKLAEDAPDRYVVVKGDTLWGIAGKFLRDPWRWPEIWRMNQDQIRSPHRIYPGNIIVLDRSKGGPQLKLATPVQKLDPRARVEKIESDIPSIAPGKIEPFLSQPLVIEAGSLDSAPRIVATQEDRVYVGAGNTAFVIGMDQSKHNLWQVYRPGKPLIDPDDNSLLGYEAIFLGTARVAREGNPTTIELISTAQEIGRGDRLVPAARALPLNYAPHAPDNFVQGRIVSTYGGHTETGSNSIITINRGTRDGIEIGHVLALYRYGKYFDDITPANPKKQAASPADDSKFWTGPAPTTIPSTSSGGKTKVRLKLPDERYGLIFVFRVFERVSYALVLNVTRPVNVSDVVQSP